MSGEFLLSVQQALAELNGALRELNNLWDDALVESEVEGAFKSGDPGAPPALQPASDALDVLTGLEAGAGAEEYMQYIDELVRAFQSAATASGARATAAASAAKVAVTRISAPRAEKVLPAEIFQAAVDLLLKSAYAISLYIESVEDPSEYGAKLPTLASLVERLLALLATVRVEGGQSGPA